MMFRNKVTLAVCILLLSVCAMHAVFAEGDEVKGPDLIRLVNNNHLPQKVLVVYSYSTSRFVKDLFNVIKEINEGDHVPASERIKLHIVSSGGNPVASLGISSEDAAKYVEVNSEFQTSDIWMQDCMELCAAQKSGTTKWVPAVFDSNRGRGLAGFPKALAKMWDLHYFRNPSNQYDHGDYGGNIEITPFDDILVSGNTMTDPCEDFFERSGYAGRIFHPQTSWLSVGHIDEYMMFIPTAHAPGGYSIVRADPGYALELLTNLPDSEFENISGSQRNFLLKVKHVLNAQLTDSKAGRGTPEGDFIELNRNISDMIEDNVGKLKDFIRKTSKDYDRDIEEVAWPTFFQGRNPSKPSGCCAYLPGVVNMLVLRDHLLVPACYIPAFDRIIEARFRAQGNTVHFVDDSPYHTSMGEIHCGTNVLRSLDKTIVTPERLKAVQNVRSRFKAIHSQPGN